MVIGSSMSVNETPASTSGGRGAFSMTRGSSRRGPPFRASTVAISEPCAAAASASASGVLPRCSASRVSRARCTKRLAAASSAATASTHSLSRPMERLARLAEPITSSRSSTAISLACRLIGVGGSPAALTGIERAQALPGGVGGAQPVQKPGAAAIHDRGLDRALADRRAEHQGLRALGILEPGGERLGDRRHGQILVLDVDRAAPPARWRADRAPRPRGPPAGRRTSGGCARSRPGRSRARARLNSGQGDR